MSPPDRTLKRVVDCVDEHTAQCFDAALQRLFNQVVAGAKETIAEVCLPGTTQEGETSSAGVSLKCQGVKAGVRECV